MSPNKMSEEELFSSDLLKLESLGEIERRSFLTKFASTVFAGLIAPAAFARGVQGTSTRQAPAWFPKLPEAKEGEDVLIRMMRELQVALAKPEQDRRWIMVIDLRKCTGCHACTVACAAENKLPPGVMYRPVREEEFGTYPNVGRKFIPKLCMQCDKPPCVPVCPAKGATYKGKDGLVHIDYDKCIGCAKCVAACPYDARTMDTGENFSDGTPGKAQYELVPTFDWNVARVRGGEEPPAYRARKCHFCMHRLQRGMLPMCVSSCIGRATYFGDANNPNSLVSELIAQPKVTRMKEELGLQPRVYYLN